jgi:integrase
MRQRSNGTGMCYRRSESGPWWIQYHGRGRTYRESSHTTDRRKAERFLRYRLAQLASQTFAGPQVERVKVDELAEDFLRDYQINGLRSIDDARTRWELHLRPFFGGTRAADLSTTHLGLYIERRQAAGARNATINRELACLNRMFHLGFQAEPPKVLRVPRFPRLTENNTRKGFVEDDKYLKLVEGSELWFRALVECGRTYGWRHSELVNMRVSQVDLAERVIRLEPGSTKNRDGREVVMTEAVFVLLSACVADKGADDWVFTRRDGKRVLDFRGTWKLACERAGVVGLLFHDLRRTAARNLRRAGVPESVIMAVGGWRTNSVFRRYAIVNRNDHREAMHKLEEHDRVVFGHNFGHSAAEAVQVAMPKSIN